MLVNKKFSNKIFIISIISILVIISTILIFKLQSKDNEIIIKKATEKQIEKELPKVGSKENLIKIVGKSLDYSINYNYGMFDETREGMMKESETLDDVQSNTNSNKSEESSNEDYSTTNTQVEGVDEADIIKIDGDYIYHINKNRLIITNVSNPKDMKIIKSIEFDDVEFNANEIYIDSNYVTVIGQKLYQYSNFVKAIAYNISDKKNIQKEREFEVEGYYISSRKIGENVYIISNKDLMYYPMFRSIYSVESEDDIEKIIEENTQVDIVPSYKDGDDYKKIDYNDIRYFPDNQIQNYLIISAFNIKEKDKKATIDTYLGTGTNIYASTKNLYVAASSYGETIKTSIYKFALDGLDISYINKGEIDGDILNQFSMDENNGYFRVATTENNVFLGSETEDVEQSMKNHIFILDKNMKNVGEIKDIAPGERIYSARFMGDRAYIVTFKTVDPLFVIDVKDPKKPEILGALKIPGFSDYLHPYDENHIIGFGKDTVEKDGMAYHMGLKMALFDVSNVKKPQQKFSEIIGDRGSSSELLNNHKALLFSKEKNIVAFPVQLAKVNDEIENNNDVLIPEYGLFEFQGAYIYGLDIEKGFNLNAKVTHLSKEDYLKSGYSGANDKYIRRIIYSKDILYTISNDIYKAIDMKTMKELGEIKIK